MVVRMICRGFENVLRWCYKVSNMVNGNGFGVGIVYYKDNVFIV